MNDEGSLPDNFTKVKLIFTSTLGATEKSGSFKAFSTFTQASLDYVGFKLEGVFFLGSPVNSDAAGHRNT